MACMVCQHCQGQFLRNDSIAVREGYSYHKKCHKCYVCSETNLHNAEVFKGVIFCSSCSKRIFQGCSTARRSKNENKSQSIRVKPRAKRRDRRQHERRVKKTRTRHTNGVLELTRLTASTESDYNNSDKKNSPRLSNTLDLSIEQGFQMSKEIYEGNLSDLKKQSIEMGMTTEVTQDLLREMNCPVVTERKHASRSPSAKSRAADKGDSKFNKTIICSDLRIAELGASTEIAHMALRKRSEVPVIIKSESGRKEESSTLSALEQVSDASGDGNEEWLDSTYYSEDSENKGWLDRRIGSILKMPYRCFKRNILNRSPLITIAMDECESRIFFRKLKMLFNEKSIEHQQRGVKKLYPTINKRKIPYKLGWLTLMGKVSAVFKPNLAIKDETVPTFRCEHLNMSPSYRCMRAQVMRLAGPTKSQLFSFRNKIKKIVLPKFLTGTFNFKKNYSTIMMSRGCGSYVHGSSAQL